MIMKDYTGFLKKLPKTELHLHIEGTLEPELLFELARRNAIPLKYSSIAALKEAYCFSKLQDFLDIYYEGASVLRTQTDFYDLTMAYMKRIQEDGVVHTEVFFDPQTHTARGIEFNEVINGIVRALKDAEIQLGITSRLILCFLRHLDEKSAFATLEQALPYKEYLAGVGLDSSEKGNPPSKFRRVFARARAEGLLTVAHAGEEGTAANVRDALRELDVFRIDHGNAAIHDEELMAELAKRKIPLTICPLSNLSLQVVPDLNEHPLKQLMQKGVLVTVNSDDPAYFGGYINMNYQAVAEALDLTITDLGELAKNSFYGSLLSGNEIQYYVQKIEELVEQYA